MVRLERNYRSTPSVLTLANRLMRGRRRRARTASRDQRDAAEQVARRSAAFETDLAEAAAIADAIAARDRGRAPGPSTSRCCTA